MCSNWELCYKCVSLLDLVAYIEYSNKTVLSFFKQIGLKQSLQSQINTKFAQFYGPSTVLSMTSVLGCDVQINTLFKYGTTPCSKEPFKLCYNNTLPINTTKQTHTSDVTSGAKPNLILLTIIDTIIHLTKGNVSEYIPRAYVINLPTFPLQPIRG